MLVLFLTVLFWLHEAAFVMLPIVFPIVLWVQAYQSYHNDNDRGWIIVIVFALVFTSIGVKSTTKHTYRTLVIQLRSKAIAALITT